MTRCRPASRSSSDGYADRLEARRRGPGRGRGPQDGKYPASGGDREHPRLGLYQLAVEHGALRDLTASGGAVPDLAASGGAVPDLAASAAVPISPPRRRKTGPAAAAGLRPALRVQRQEPQQPGDDGLRPIERQLAEAVGHLRAEVFPARPGSHCDHCEFARFCPAQTSGTVLT
ncbi:MAG: PD-(D/E)XK nuclease family protein [Nocardioides sp.]